MDVRRPQILALPVARAVTLEQEPGRGGARWPMSSPGFRFVPGAEIDRLQLTHREIPESVEEALRAQGNGQEVK